MVILIKGDFSREIPIQTKKADSFFPRLRGLMFKKTLPENEGLLITPCNSIHMFFMRFPIDAVFLDKHLHIVQLRENVRPWTIIPPVPPAFSTLELKAGTIKKYDFQIGERIIV